MNSIPKVDASFARPTQQLRSKRSLERLIEAAKAILRREGLDGLTIGAVAEEARVSVGGLYRRFENKETLLLAIHDAMVTGLEDAVSAQLSGARSLSDVVGGLVRGHTRMFGPDEHLYATIFSLGRQQPKQRERAQRSIQANFVKFSQAVLPFRSEIVLDDFDLAVACAFHLVLGAAMTRVGRPAAPPFSLLSWAVLEAQISHAALAYLTIPAGRAPTGSA